ncbi:MAG: type I-E CRISPR-associated protein Cas5/CasD [Methylococcaceae bacterium]|nr:type I-E CRISPR-associated protein Cas5/CasD [Methylococcaceae bacterium]
MSTRYLLLWLESPLQSWGHDSKFGRRDTLNFPTKSGVLGMVCCALGAGGEQKELLAEFAPLQQTVLSFVRTRKKSEDERVKLDREPLLRDFQMVGSGYDDKDPWQSLLIPKTAEGKKAVGGGAKLTYRYYLQDAYFAVVLEVPNDKSEKIAKALQAPAWDLYLGRKSCVPTDFIFRECFDSEDEAIKAAQVIATEKSLLEDFRVLDGEYEGDEVFSLNDVPVCFGEHKVYRDRRVTVVNV